MVRVLNVKIKTPKRKILDTKNYSNIKFHPGKHYVSLVTKH